MSSTAGSPPEKKKGMLEIARDSAFIAAVYLYFAGFVYNYAFYEPFALRTAPGDLPLTTLIAYSYFVLRGSVWLILLLVAVWLLLARIFRDSPGVRIAVHVAAIVALFPIVAWIAHREGLRAGVRARQRINCPTVTLVLHSESLKAMPPEFTDANTGHRLHLLVETKEHFYVFEQDDPEAGELPYGRVFSVPKTEIVSAIIDTPSFPVGSKS